MSGLALGAATLMLITIAAVCIWREEQANKRHAKQRAKAFADKYLNSAKNVLDLSALHQRRKETQDRIDQLRTELASIYEKRKKMFAFRDAQRRKNLPFWRRS